MFIGYKIRFVGRAPRAYAALTFLGVANLLAYALSDTKMPWNDAVPENVRVALQFYSPFGWIVYGMLMAGAGAVALTHPESVRLEKVTPAPASGIGSRPATRLDIIIASTVAAAFIGFAGAIFAGAAAVALSPMTGVAVGGFVTAVAVVAIDGMIASFPDGALSPRRRVHLAAWSAVVCAAVLITIGWQFRG